MKINLGFHNLTNHIISAALWTLSLVKQNWHQAIKHRWRLAVLVMVFPGPCQVSVQQATWRAVNTVLLTVPLHPPQVGSIGRFFYFTMDMW